MLYIRGSCVPEICDALTRPGWLGANGISRWVRLKSATGACLLQYISLSRVRLKYVMCLRDLGVHDVSRVRRGALSA